MNRRLLRPVALALCLLFLAPIGLLPARAETAMPAGVTKEAAADTAARLETAAERLMKTNPQLGGLKGQVYAALYSDQTLNGLLTGVYGGFAENESTLKTLGVDISTAAVASALAGYPEVAAAVARYEDWKTLAADKGFAPRWNISSQDQFGYAVAAVFSPLNDLLFTVLCAGTYRSNVIVSVQGGNGYENVLVPLLTRLGCPSIMTQAAFTEAAAADKSAMAVNLVRMLFASLDALFAAPVTGLCLRLPAIADYLVNGGLSEGVKALMEPLTVRIAIFSLPGVSKLIENTDMFASSQDLSSMLSGLDTSALSGGVKLTIPKIDLEALAACGTAANGGYQADTGAAFVVILRWLIEAVKQNQANLPALLGTDAALDSLAPILKKDTDALVLLVVRLFHMGDQPLTLDPTWTYPAQTPGTISFTPNLTRENYDRMRSMIDDTLNDFVSEFTDKGSLSTLLSQTIYSNRLLGELAKGVFGAMGGEEAAGLFSALGIGVTPSGVAASIRGACPAAARTLAAAASWDKVDPASLSFGFADGNKTGFVNALTALLRPFLPLLRMLLAEGKYDVLGAVTLPGSNGYESAIIPLFEGLSLPAAAIKPYAAYKASSNTDAALTDLLAPVTALLDLLIAQPVETLCERLPNIAYFLSSDLPKQCVENLLYPVKELLRQLELESLLPADLLPADSLDTTALFSQLTEGSELPITLPAPDLALLAGLGTAVEQQSLRTHAGGATVYTCVMADPTAVMVTLLRYIVGAIKNSGGLDLDSLMANANTDANAGEAGGNADMFAMYTGKIGEELHAMSVDEVIEWLYNLLFAETPKRADAGVEEEIPTIIYHEKKHFKGLPYVIGFLIAGLIVAGALVYTRVDFAALKEARKKKKKAKRAAAPPKKRGRKNAGAAGKRKPKKTKTPAAPPVITVPVTRYAPVSPAPGVSAADRAPAQNSALPEKGAAQPLTKDMLLMPVSEMGGGSADAAPSGREERRREKAARAALRATRKADKHYRRVGR